MKLIFCRSCRDVVALYVNGGDRKCMCGRASGRYTDGLNATISGDAIPLGFDNSSFMMALRHRPQRGVGQMFEAFVIPAECDTVQRETL